MSAWRLWLEERDRALLGVLVRNRRERLTMLMRAVTALGEPVAATALGLLLLSGVLVPTAGAGGEAFAALVISHLFVQSLKRSIARERPAHPVGLSMLVEPPDRFSFPSGHAAAAMSMAVPLALAYPGLIGMSLLLLAFLIGVSRPYLGVHYPGDVIVGWALGVVGAVMAPPVVAWF